MKEDIPVRESLVSDIPALDGKIANPFLQCIAVRDSHRTLEVSPWRWKTATEGEKTYSYMFVQLHNTGVHNCKGFLIDKKDVRC
jgi:hypothetical protein